MPKFYCSASPPPVWNPHWPGVKEFFGQHHAVAFEHHPVFHDETNIAQGVDVGKRIARDCDDVSEIALLDRAPLFCNVSRPVAVDRKRAQDVRGGDARWLPCVQECDAELAAAQPLTGLLVFHAVIPVIEVGRECQRHFLFPGIAKISDSPPERFLGSTVLCKWSVCAIQKDAFLRHLAVML